MMSKAKSSARNLLVMAALIVILWVNFALRLEHITGKSLWFDEVNTGMAVREAHLDPQRVPARTLLYMALVAPWYAMVPDDLGLRLPSIMAGVAAGAVIFRIGKRVHSERAGVIASALLAVSSHFIHYAREARFYSLVLLFSLIVLWLALRLKSEPRKAEGGFIAGAALLAGLHLLAALWLAALIGMLALRKWLSGDGPRWRVLAGVIAAIGAVLALLRIWGLTRGQIGFNENLAWIARLSSYPLVYDFPITVLGIDSLPRWGRLIVIGLLICLAAASLWKSKLRLTTASRWHLVMLVALSVVPIAGLYVISWLLNPVWVMRYAMPSVGSAVVFTAIVLAFLPRQWAGTVAALILIVASGAAYLRRPDRQVEDWRGAASYLQAHIEEGDLIFACRVRAALPLSYYAPAIDYYYLPADSSASRGTSMDLVAEVTPPPSAIPAGTNRVWMLQSLEQQPCTFADDEIAVPSWLEDAPSQSVGFENVVLHLFEATPGAAP